jgi:RNA polymerase-binding transcription factor DksA
MKPFMALTREQALELCCVIEDRRAALLDGQAEVSREVGELRQLDEARRRFDEGSYGSCVDCGRDIDYRRLRANPSAIRCIHCQERYEKQRMVELPGGHRRL